MTTNTTETKPFYLTEPCPTWCRSVHDDGWGIGRWHFAEEREIVLTLEDYEEPRDTEPPTVEVVLGQAIGAREAQVAVEHNQHPAFTMTLAEAQAMGEHLLDFVRMARTNAAPPQRATA
jgi:hypothetical protein